MPRRLRREDYTVGWVCALPIELAAALEMLDEQHDDFRRNLDDNDENLYTLGLIGAHNVVIVCLPAGRIGNNPAATVAMQMRATFKGIRFALMTGIGGGVPSADFDIRLGDVVVSQPHQTYAGVVQYDAGKSTPSGFVRTGSLNSPPQMLLAAVTQVKANKLLGRSRLSNYIDKLSLNPEFQRNKTELDVLFEAAYNHEGGQTCSGCNTNRQETRQPRDNEKEVVVHYGTIASGNQVIKNAVERDRLSTELGGILCFEMEAAGLMNGFPCLVVRGICDYADSHKNKRWQGYAAGTAAAYAKEVLSFIPAAEIAKTRTAEDVVRETVGPQKEIKKPSGERATALPPNLRSSTLEQHDGNVPKFGCQTCDRKFPTKEGLNQHMDIKNHWARSKNRASDENYRSNLVVNQRKTAIGHGSPLISCRTCVKKFPTQSAANEHMAATGHGNPDISCKTCAKKFFRQSAANEHMAAVRH